MSDTNQPQAVEMSCLSRPSHAPRKRGAMDHSLTLVARIIPFSLQAVVNPVLRANDPTEGPEARPPSKRLFFQKPETGNRKPSQLTTINCPAVPRHLIAAK
jgi:hypothetical protein